MAKTKKKAAKKVAKKPAKKAKKAAVKKAAPIRAAPKKAAPKKAAPKKAAPKKAAPTKAAPKKAAPKKAAPKKTAPKIERDPEAIAAAPDDAALDDLAAQAAPDESAVDDGWSDAADTASPATNGAPADRFRPVADALVGDLQDARGDDAKETAALQKAIDGYLAISGGGIPAELGLAEYFAEEGSATSPPAFERVPNASEDDIFRWREKLADLAGY